MVIGSVKALISKDITLEWRQKSALGGLLLYLVSTVFVCYLAFAGVITVQTWNALFWIVMVFASLNAVLKGSIQESESRMVYYYTLAPPHAVITARIIYNAIIMWVLSLLGWTAFVAFLGNPVQNPVLFLLNMLLGVAGLSSVMSMVSAIAAKARNNFTLMGVLSFPLVLPLILVLIRVSGASMAGDSLTGQLPNLLVLTLLTAISLVLANLLFPYIWRD